MEKEKIKKLLVGVAISCAGIFFVASPVFAQSAVLYLSPSTGTHTVGSTFAVTVYVSSTSQAINAVSGLVSFSPDSLEVASLSSAGSILSIWTQTPSFDNSAGTVNFEGIVPNPGFMGAAGKITTINFKVISKGSATVNFLSGSALANDGNGTEILKSLGSAQFTLSAASSGAPAPPVTTPQKPVTQKPSTQTPSAANANLPPAPQISSSTNPDQNKWYNNNNPMFAWQLSPDIIAVKTLFNKSPVSQPTITHSPGIAETALENLNNGVYYFHVQFENSAGWGPVSNFRFQIDTQQPDPFVIKLLDGAETDNPQPTISFNTTDALSGIDYYKIKINNGEFFAIPSSQIINDSYALPLQLPGQKSVLVMAVDKAGNDTVAYAEFTITSITPPTITGYPQKLGDTDILTVKGNSYPDSQIIIWLQKDGGAASSQAVTSDGSGNFTFTANERLESGTYTMWAQVVDKRGAKSDSSQKITIIQTRSIIFEIQTWLIDNIITAFLSIVLVFLVILLLVIHIYGERIAVLKVPKRMRKS